MVTGLSGLAALGLVALMAYAKELEAEQAHRRSRREEADAGCGPNPASFGYPGAWDDDDFEAHRAAEG